MREIIRKFKEKQYYKQRAKKWEKFKINNEELICGLVKEENHPRLWEYDCFNCSYDKDFFEQYGCMYVKGFMNY